MKIETKDTEILAMHKITTAMNLVAWSSRVSCRIVWWMVERYLPEYRLIKKD